MLRRAFRTSRTPRGWVHQPALTRPEGRRESFSGPQPVNTPLDAPGTVERAFDQIILDEPAPPLDDDTTREMPMVFPPERSCGDEPTRKDAPMHLRQPSSTGEPAATRRSNDDQTREEIPRMLRTPPSALDFEVTRKLDRSQLRRGRQQLTAARRRSRRS